MKQDNVIVHGVIDPENVPILHVGVDLRQLTRVGEVLEFGESTTGQPTNSPKNAEGTYHSGIVRTRDPRSIGKRDA
jgi:hypothetical protein